MRITVRWIPSMCTFSTRRICAGSRCRPNETNTVAHWCIRRCHSSDTVTPQWHTKTKCLCGAAATTRLAAIYYSVSIRKHCDGANRRCLEVFQVYGMAIRRASPIILCIYLAASKRKSINFHVTYIALIWKRWNGNSYRRRASRPAIVIFIQLPYWIIECLYLGDAAIVTVRFTHRKRFIVHRLSIWIWKRDAGIHRIQRARYRWDDEVIRHSFITSCYIFLAAITAYWINILTICIASIRRRINGVWRKREELYRRRDDDKFA